MIHGDFIIREVDGTATAEVLHYLNAQDAQFPELKDHHLEQGYWWLARTWSRAIVGFAGMVPKVPYPGVGYFKRCWISPTARGNGLQMVFMRLREAKARELGWTTLTSEVAGDNQRSIANFLKAGFTVTEPEQPWGAPGSVYFVKRLTA
jgi:RimJ/RimL family protein N-acetyltransferase